MLAIESDGTMVPGTINNFKDGVWYNIYEPAQQLTQAHASFLIPNYSTRLSGVFYHQDSQTQNHKEHHVSWCYIKADYEDETDADSQLSRNP